MKLIMNTMPLEFSIPLLMVMHKDIRR